MKTKNKEGGGGKFEKAEKIDKKNPSQCWTEGMQIYEGVGMQ